MEDSIIDVFRGCHLFDTLSDDKINALCSQALIESYQKGQTIISEGDLGERFYLIQSGAAQVFTHNLAGNEIVLARLEAGDYFGEQALQTEQACRRNASVRAISELKALTISHQLFQQLLKNNKPLKNWLLEHGRVQLIIKLTKQLQDDFTQQQELYSLFTRVEHFDKRQVFFRPGDKAAYAYFLFSGDVEIRTFGDDGLVTVQKTVRPGQFFNEQEVLEDKIRTGIAVSITNSEVAIVDASLLKSVFKKNISLKKIINAQMGIFKVPLLGRFTQYQSYFLGKPTMNTALRKDNGEVLIACRVIDADIFSIAYLHTKEIKVIVFQKASNYMREIILENNILVGVISFGLWCDLEKISNQVYKKPLITEEMLEVFRKTGTIPSGDQKQNEGILCECMQVRIEKITDCIASGVTTLQSVSRITGAGTVCGSCQPKIIELLGENAWTDVRAVCTREHNMSIRSFQLQPLEGPLVPAKPGQYVVVEATIDGVGVSRSYTLTSIDTDYYEITVKREEHGLFSQWLFNQDKTKVNLRISKPQGHLVAPLEGEDPILCFVGGIGITPAIAFARKLYSMNKEKSLHIDYSVRNEQHIAFLDELNEWKHRCSNISVDIRFTQSDGYLKENKIGELLLEYAGADVFICGPKAYQESIVSTLHRLGVPKYKIHIEQFVHAGEPINLVH